MTAATETMPAAKRPRRMAREPKPELAASGAPIEAAAVDPADPSPKTARPQSKSALVLELLGRPEGATIDQMVTATGWLSHTTRAVLTGFKKKGHVLVSEKPAGGPRIYRATGMAEAG